MVFLGKLLLYIYPDFILYFCYYLNLIFIVIYFFYFFIFFGILQVELGSCFEHVLRVLGTLTLNFQVTPLAY